MTEASVKVTAMIGDGWMPVRDGCNDMICRSARWSRQPNFTLMTKRAALMCL